MGINKPIETMTVTNIAMWSAGKEPIRNTDIASREPLRIVSKGECKILEANVVQENNSANAVQCEQFGDNEVVIGFEFLGKGDGAVIQIFHSGMTNSDLEFKGELIGTSIKFETLPFTRRIFQTWWSFIIIVIAMGLFAGGGSLLSGKHYLAGTLVLSISLVAIFLNVYEQIVPEIRKSVPSSLDAFGKLQ